QNPAATQSTTARGGTRPASPRLPRNFPCAKFSLKPPPLRFRPVVEPGNKLRQSGTDQRVKKAGDCVQPELIACQNRKVPCGEDAHQAEAAGPMKGSCVGLLTNQLVSLVVFVDLLPPGKFVGAAQ